MIAPAVLILVACGLASYESEGPYEAETFFSQDPDDKNTLQSQGQNINETGGSPYFVKEVIDGDTFIIENGESIRLIGINTPEIDRYFYEEAKLVLKNMIEGQKVRLERDISDRDRYGRLLRYVYLEELFVNLEMVKRGFANVFTMVPDVKYQDEFLAAERYARENNIGLWKLSQYSPDMSFSYQSPEKINIKIHENAAGDDRENLNDEYVILSNNLNLDINISGWTVKDSATNIYEFGSHIFKSNSQIQLFSGSGHDGNGIFYWNSTTPIWNNDHDTLYLRDKEGLLVGFLDY